MPCKLHLCSEVERILKKCHFFPIQMGRDKYKNAVQKLNCNEGTELGLNQGMKKPSENIKEEYMKRHNNWMDEYLGKSVQSNADETEDNRDSFHNTMKAVILLAQVFALLPISGATGSSRSSVKFHWRSWMMLYNLSVLGAVVFVLIVTILSTILDTSTYSRAADIMFYITSTLTPILFIKLAVNWPDICHKWQTVERHMKEYGYPRHMNRICKIHVWLFMTISIGEHLLWRAGNFHKLMSCPELRKNFYEIWKVFTRKSDLFQFLPYNPLNGLLVLIGNAYGTFSWSFPNLFIPVISFQITARFKQINRKLLAVRGKDLPVIFWRKVREDFDSLSKLTKYLDSQIEYLMVVAFANNVYYMCLQLFQGLRFSQTSYRLIYFFYSFGFLVYRIIFLSFTAAMINDESKLPLQILHSVPYVSYSNEVKRFISQVTTDEVAFTGCRFFSITRSLILTIAGTMVTYEIILLQFDTREDDVVIEDININICNSD